MKTLFTIAFILTTIFTFAQPSQTVRGKVVDNETNFPLVSAKIEIFTGDSTIKYRVLSDLDGAFETFNIVHVASLPFSLRFLFRLQLNTNLPSCFLRF